ncbi:MAG TPA: hypothetical protein VGL58_04675 [Caulobacteraceae bacterium]|jgi:hypothetical protein
MSSPPLEHGRLSPQTRPYAIGYMVCIGAMGLAMPVVAMTFRYLHPNGVLAALVAALPAAPLVGAMAFLGLWVRAEPDEYQRAVRVEAMLWALGVVFAVYTMLGFLMVWGPLGASKISAGLLLALIFPAWLTIYSGAVGLVRRRYR